METFLISGISWPESGKGVLEPKAGKDAGSTVSGADDVKCVDTSLADESVDVSVDEGKAGAGSPVAEKARLDVIGGNIAFDESIVLQEDHSWRYTLNVRTDSVGIEETHQPRCNLQHAGTA